MRDTRESSGAYKKPTLCNIAGELQDIIITNLHPSAVIALSLTSRYLFFWVSLRRLPSSLVFDYLQKKELLRAHADDYACYSCLRLKR